MAEQCRDQGPPDRIHVKDTLKLDRAKHPGRMIQASERRISQVRRDHDSYGESRSDPRFDGGQIGTCGDEAGLGPPEITQRAHNRTGRARQPSDGSECTEPALSQRQRDRRKKIFGRGRPTKAAGQARRQTWEVRHLQAQFACARRRETAHPQCEWSGNDHGFPMVRSS